MSREEEVQYEQDNQGNERKKLDTLRAQEGMDETAEEGLTEVVSADTGSDLLLYSLPTHADAAYVDEVHAWNSEGSAANFSLFEAQLDGSGSITSTTRRSVPFVVDATDDVQISYSGEKFEDHIAVNSDFIGYVGVGVVVDHKEYNEPASEQTS